MANAMSWNSNRARELSDLLRKELGIPENVKWFEVRFAVDETVSVKCEYDAKVTPSDG